MERIGEVTLHGYGLSHDYSQVYQYCPTGDAFTGCPLVYPERPPVTRANRATQADGSRDLHLACPAEQPAFGGGRGRRLKLDVQGLILAPLRSLRGMDLPLGDEARGGGREMQADGLGPASPRTEIALEHGSNVEIRPSGEDRASTTNRAGPIEKESA